MKNWAIAVGLFAVVVSGCKLPRTNNLPPASRLMHPGPGVDGPGPGVLMGEPMRPYATRSSQIAFIGPDGMMVNWDVRRPGMFDSEPIICPGRQNFHQGAIYRLKLTNIPGRPGIELYPTLEVGPSLPRTDAFLSHNAIPAQWTEEDFDQVLTGNFVTKVIYLPDAEHQELALAGIQTLVSTRLDPGLDPIIEADRQGSILAIIRMGNKDLEIPGGMPNMAGRGVMASAYFGGGPASLPGQVAGLTAPQYGMPISGTPIGLPGPPHIPLGIPAGLKKHTIRNHTKFHLPKPTDNIKIDVKQRPGFRYPKPASRALITESNWVPPVLLRQPLFNKVKKVQ